VRWQWIIRAFLVIWLSFSLAQAFWLLFPAPPLPAPTLGALPIASGSATADASSPAIDLEQLKSLTPFGAETKEAVPEQQQAAPGIENDATDTQLNLVLRGVLASNDDAAARAVIAAGDKADVYAIGDKLPVGNNVTLAKVLEVRVILNNNGHYESLWLFKDDPSAGNAVRSYAPATAQNAPPNNGQRVQKRLPRQLGPNGVPLSAVNPGAVVNPESAANPGFSGNPGPQTQAQPEQISQTLADVVAMSIYREDGQVVGYKIRPGRNVEMFNSLGLQTDDIVTAVNGVPLSSPAKVMEIYKNMNNATSASLEIRRGGSVINLDVALQ